MKIVKCSNCGKYIHTASKCYHCGNDTGFEETRETTVHENVAVEYTRLESLVETKKYDEAINLSYKVIEWMPSLAGVYWLRLLAKKHCSSAIELICKGFDYDEDSDFCNALSMSQNEEHSAYEDLKRVVVDFGRALQGAVLEHEHDCKAETDVMQLNNEMDSKIELHRNRLMEAWADLENTEQALYSLEMDCRLLSKEYQDTLEKAAEKAASIKSETYRMEECTEEQLQAFQVRIGAILQSSEEARNAIDGMKNQHPWVKSFANLVNERDKKVQILLSEITTLKSFENTVSQTLTVIERIEERHKRALRAIHDFNFVDAAELLGISIFDEVLRTAGVGVKSVISVSAEGWKNPKKEQVSVSVQSEDDELDMEEYYAAWGINMN